MRIIKTSWNHDMKVGILSIDETTDRAIVVVQFTNGHKHRSIKTFTTEEAKDKIKMLTSYVKDHDFPWVDTIGNKQWKELPETTLEF